MYEDLVKRLRELQVVTEHCDEQSCYECANKELCDKLDNKTLSGIHKEAADTIEELSRAQERQITLERNALLKSIPRWIPVTEKLPSEELAFYLCYTDAGMVVECLWTNNKYGLGPFGHWGWRLMDVPQYQKVTYWQPLPEPPKEET